jgi:hypothetical protein
MLGTGSGLRQAAYTDAEYVIHGNAPELSNSDNANPEAGIIPSSKSGLPSGFEFTHVTLGSLYDSLGIIPRAENPPARQALL